jgi:hypothetical protein
VPGGTRRSEEQDRCRAPAAADAPDSRAPACRRIESDGLRPSGAI